MNELVTILNQVLDQRFPEYNRTLINLLRMDIQMIVSMATRKNPQDENVRNLIMELNELLNSIENYDSKKQEFLGITIRHHLKQILKKAGG